MIAPETLQPGDQLGPYVVRGLLRASLMSTVYLGEASDDPRVRVAIKVIHPNLASNEAWRQRFQREVQFAQKVEGPCTAKVLFASYDAERLYLVSEYIDAPTLEQRVYRDGPLRASELVRLALGMALALEAIHRAKVVHRDLKPSNVMYTPSMPTVIDFGIARALDDPSVLTLGGQALGTPPFMAPEQITGGKVAAAADVFAWGGVLIFAATGNPPFGLDDLTRRITRDDPDFSCLDGQLRGLVEAAMKKVPSLRPTAETLRRRLQGVGPESAGPVAEETVAQQVRRTTILPGASEARSAAGESLDTANAPPGSWTRKVLVALAGAVGLSLLLGVSLLIWWILHGIATNLGFLLLAGLGYLLAGGALVVGWIAAQDADDVNDGLGRAAVALVVAGLLAYLPYHELHDQYWVTFDQDAVAVLKGSGPGGFLGVHHTGWVERSATQRGQIPPLLAGLVDQGVSVTGRDEGRYVARCLPALFTAAPDGPVGPGDDVRRCTRPVFDNPPLIPIPSQHTQLADTTDTSPALVALGGRVLLAWTGKNDGLLHLRDSTTDGLHFGPARTLPVKSAGSVALASDGVTRVFLAWTDQEGHLNVLSSTDGGVSFASPVNLKQTSSTEPALAFGAGRLLLSWTDPGSGRIHVMASSNGSSFSGEVALDATTTAMPSLGFAGRTWYLSWLRSDDGRLAVKSSDDGVNFRDVSVPEQLSKSRPILAALGVWMLAWTGVSDDAINLLVSKSDGAEFVNRLVLAAQSSSAVNMTTFNGHVLLAWADASDQRAIHVATII